MLEKKHKQFIAALKTGAIGVIETLLNENPGLIYYKDNAGSTAIHAAAAGGQNSTIEFLLSKGLDINTKNNNGSTAIHAAAAGGHNSTIEFLQSKGLDINAKTNDGSTVIHTAAASGQNSTIEFLLSKGLDINAKTNDGKTAMHIAVYRKQNSTIELLQSKMFEARAYRPASTPPSRYIPITHFSRPTPTTHITPLLQETRSTPAPINIPQPNPSLFSSAPPPFVHSSQAFSFRDINIESIIARQSEKITQQENMLLQQNTLLQKLLVEMESVKQQNLLILNFMNSQIAAQIYTRIEPQPQVPNPLGAGSSTSITTQSLSPEQESTLSPEVLPQIFRIKEERIEVIIDEEGTDEELESPSLKRKRKEPIKSEDAQENTNGNKRLHVENLSQYSKPKSSRDTHPTTFSGRESTSREKNPENRQQYRAI